MPLVSLSLKQKLSNLSLSQSFSSNSASTSSTLGRGRPNFNPFSARRDSSDSYSTDGEGPDTIDDQSLDDIMQRVIRQAGVDFETRPMVVITAAEFPDPKKLSYDLLFKRMLRHLDLYVESDYTVVFLVAGGAFAPSWGWVWKAYRSLHRKYRKNLKKLYIVHTTMFSKMLFSLAGAVISPKFFRKIQYISTLSELANCVPLTNLDLHPAVYRENLKHEREITLPSSSYHDVRSQMFGVDLIELMGEDGQSSGLPRAVKDCVEEIRREGLLTEGLFRRSPNSAMLRQVQEAYNRGQPVSLSSFNDPHIPAVLIKKFFRDLPNPVFPEFTYSVIQACPYPYSYDDNNDANHACVEYIRTNVIPLIENISPPAMIVLSYVLNLLHEVSLRSKANRMDAANLALCFTPNLVAGSNIMKDIQLCSIPGVNSKTLMALSIPTTPSKSGKTPPMTLALLVKVCIEQYYEIFEELPDRTNTLSSSTSAFPTHPSRTLPPSSTFGTTFTGTTAVSRSSALSPRSSSLSSPSNSGYGTPLEQSIFSEHTPSTPATNANSGPYRTPLPASSVATSPNSSISFTTAEDSDDDDPDAAVLVMPLGPSEPSSLNGTPSASSPAHGPPSAWNRADVGIGHPSSPLSAGRKSHRRKESALSTQTAKSATGTIGTSSTLSDAARYASGNGTLRTARSIISIENGKSGPGGSIRVGRPGLGVGVGSPASGANGSAGAGTMRRPSGAGVEAVGVTAAGFFSPISPDHDKRPARVSEGDDVD